MEERDIRSPLYYVMGRDIEAAKVQHAFLITPCVIGVVANNADHLLIQRHVDDVFQSPEQACREMAAHIARSTHSTVLTIGEGKDLVAVYPDGDEETVCLSNLTLMN